MKFDLQAPCRDCPFIKGTPMVLASGRMAGIVADLTSDDWQCFPCHKTTHRQDDEDDEGGYTFHGNEQACMGALAYTLHHHAGMLPVMARIACATGQLDIQTIRANVDRIEAPGQWTTWPERRTR